MSSKTNPLSDSVQLIHNQAPLRKITANDKFPCFSCFDKPVKRLNCQACSGMGFVHGNHPMVQFAQDYIEKKLTGKTPNPNLATSCSRILPRKQIERMPSVIQQSQPYKEEQYDQNQIRHQGIFCDNCRIDPIKGARYFCTVCDDYDLCKACYDNQVHPIHIMKVIQNPNAIRMSNRPGIQYFQKIRNSKVIKSRFSEPKK